MNITSKFSLSYILKGVFVTVFPMFMLFFVMFCTGTENGMANTRTFVFETNLVLIYLLICIVYSAIYFLLFHRFRQIRVTEHSVTFLNLLTRRKQRIEYEDIAEIRYRSTINESNPRLGRLQWADTETNSRLIITKYGKIFGYDDSIYANYKEINKAIKENTRAKSDAVVE
jgi:hypothetical protein